ncbi:MAG: glycerate kinase [Bacteroidota bacterium]
MKIVIAPDKFKGSLSARKVATAMASGARRVFPEATIIQRPLADGGEASLGVLREVYALQAQRLQVTGPLRRPIAAEYLLGNGQAFIDVAQACGLQHVPPTRRHPRNTTTIGVGELIEDALARGAHKISLFLGDSATNDAGAGMAAALGYRFFSDRGHDFIPMADSLEWAVRIDREKVLPTLKKTKIFGVCDVDNPLIGPQGATYTYALQKGVKQEELATLERNMQYFAARINDWLDVDVRDFPGAGAAGGLGAGIIAFLGGVLRPGIELIMEAVGFDTLVANADLVLTGEGSIDEQTPHGKVVSGVASRARSAGAKIIALAGRCVLTNPEQELPNVDRVASLMDIPGMTLAQAMAETDRLLEELTEKVLREFK